jgi:hypothetical protein
MMMRLCVIPLILFTALAGQAVMVRAGEPAKTADGALILFNGKDLHGWDGDPKHWSVQDGAITGQITKDNPSKGNTFLIWRGGVLKDFELRVKFRIDGGNSGIQYRGKEKGNWLVQGYQADLDAENAYTGTCYDENGDRQTLAAVGEKVAWKPEKKKEVTGSVGDAKEIKAGIRKGEWNDYVIICRGNCIIQAINGKVTVEVKDEDEMRRAMEGVLAFQLSPAGPMTVQFKDITLRVIEGENGK